MIDYTEIAIEALASQMLALFSKNYIHEEVPKKPVNMDKNSNNYALFYAIAAGIVGYIKVIHE